MRQTKKVFANHSAFIDYKQSWKINLFIISICCMLLNVIQAQDLNLIPSNNTINIVTQYEINVVGGRLNQVSDPTALVQITLPSEYFTLNTAQTYTCFNPANVAVTYSCRAISSSTLQINNPLFTGGAVFRMSVRFIKNPSSVPSSFISLKYLFRHANGTTISSFDRNSPMTYVAGTLSSSTIGFIPNLVHSSGQINFLITLGNPVPLLGSIKIEFPNSWTYAFNTSQRPLLSSVQECTLKSGATFLNSPLTCTNQSQIVQFKNCFKAAAPSNTVLQFSISNVLSPPTIFNGYTVKVTTYSNNYEVIDDTTCSITAVQRRPISGINSLTNLIVGTKSLYNFQFLPPTPIATNDTLTIEAVSPNNVFFEFTSSDIIFFSGGRLLPTFRNSTISISNFNSSWTTSDKISIVQGFFLKPLRSSGSRTLTLTLKRSTFQYASSTFTFNVDPNTLLNTAVTPTVSTVSSLSLYTFRMVLANSLDPKSKIVITLPTQLSITNGACVSTIAAEKFPSSINASYTCVASGNKVITLSTINLNALQAGQNLTITISSIRNSQSTKPSSTFKIQTFFGQTSTTTTDISENLTVTMTPAVIDSVTVSSSSPRVAQSSTYTFVYTVKSRFPAGSKIKISLPSDITFGASLSALYSISSTSTTDQSCTLSNYTTGSTQYIQLSAISSSSLASGTVFTFKISSLINPLSLKPSASFKFYLIDSSGFEIEKLETGIIVTNTQTNTFTSVTAVESSFRMNGQKTNYTIELRPSVHFLQQKINLAIDDYLEVKMDTATSTNGQMYFSSTLQSCDITYLLGGTTTKINSICERKSQFLIKITLKEAMINSRTYQIAVNTIDRQRTSEAPNTITVSCFKTVSGIFILYEATQFFGISVSTFTPQVTNRRNIVKSVALNILTNPSQLLSVQTFSITVVPQIDLIVGDFVVIEIPRIYTFIGTTVTVTATSNLVAMSSQSLCDQSIYFCSHYLSDNFKIKVQQMSPTFFNAKTIAVTIKNNLYVSPNVFSFKGDYFKASTFASNGLGIDQTVTTGTTTTNLVNAEFYLTCKNNLETYHCRTCFANDTCSTCYSPKTQTNGTIYNFDGYNIMTSDGKCVIVCGDGYFINNANNGVCTKCDSPCNTCQTTSTFCLSCLQNIVNNKLHLNTCVQNCPTRFFADASNVCQSCNSKCLTCQTNALNCLSCQSPTFLDTTINDCVSSTDCPFGTYPNISNNRCSPCDVSCSGCTSSAKNCISCAAGYIIDITITNIKACTNQCPAGTVNDTVGNKGCRCQSPCLTCVTSVSRCTSCDSSSTNRYLYSSSCVPSCPPSTYANQPSNGNFSCLPCAQSNCDKCSSTLCQKCKTDFYLYEGICVTSCPQATVAEIQAGIKKCLACMVGCLNCSLGPNTCSSCIKGYLLQAGTCTTSCSPGFYNFNNTDCLGKCPDGYQIKNQACVINSSQVFSTSQISSTRRVPFPFIIASVIFLVLIILCKIVLPQSLVSTLLTSIIGLLEPFSWLVAIIVCVIETSGGTHWEFCKKGVSLLIATLVINFVLNVIAIIFFWKYVRKDPKFNHMFTYNQRSVFLGKCPTLTVISLSVISSHKVLQSLFSNFLLSKHFSYKVQTINHIVPLNYILFCSALPSVLAIAGGSLISYELQGYGVDSSAFIAALDMILITLLGLIVSLWVTNRKTQDYEKQIGSNQIQRHYRTQQILVQGNGEYNQQNLNEVFMEKSGVRRQAAQGRSYFYENSRISQRQESHDNDPLTKRQNTIKPIHESNRQKIKGSNRTDEPSSQALVINQNLKRRNLKDQFFSQNSEGKQDDLQIIDLQNTHSNLLKDVPLITKIHYPNNEKKEKPQELAKMTSQQKMLLKKRIESQLSPQEKEKLGILSKQKQLKIKKKKEKIQQILKLDDKQTANLPNQEKNKVQKVKEAVDVLKRKQIKIQEYLLYAEIIKQEEGQYDEQSQQEISQINQKAHTIIKGIQDDDQDLQEVIKLSPKKQRIQGKQNMGKSMSKDKISQLGRLERSKSKERNELSKQKKQNSKQKTIKKDGTTNKKDKRNQRRNKSKLPNDLQVNYNTDNGQNDQNEDGSFDSEKQPQLPKGRSNIVGKSKSKNRSEKQLNGKKIAQPGDMMMIDVGSNRQNRTQNDLTGQLELERGDILPPNHLRSTQKVEYKNRNLFNNDSNMKNDFESENDIETMKSYENDVDFQNSILPTEFKVKNQKFNYVDESLDMPVKPKILAENGSNQNDVTMDKKNKNLMKHDGFDIYEGDQIDDELNYNNDKTRMDMNHTMSRYSSSNVLNYDSMLRKNMQNQKLKQLQKIYLPRLDSKANKKQKPKRQLSLSKINTSKM